MNQTVLRSCLVMMIPLIIFGISQANAETIDFEKCDQSTNHHCIQYLPENNTAPMEASSSNWHVEIHLPQNGAHVIDGIFSSDNFTNLKQNPAVMAVVNIYTTQGQPTMNYCPQAKYILENQGKPQYLDRFYNASKNIDLTGYVYPSNCFIESGANPINGQDIPRVPEFPTVMLILLVSISGIIFAGKYGKKRK